MRGERHFFMEEGKVGKYALDGRKEKAERKKDES